MAKILLAKFESVDSPLDLRQVDTAQGAYITKLRESGFLDFVASEQPMAEPGESVIESLEIIDGKLIQSWVVKSSI
ncbi:hypothetical protein IX307_001212 [Bacteroides pyogenes]|uniref:Uncharacterized protein n=3 Tax=Bacteroides pyogenes TaxID=310300 RepID=A0A5D3FQC6_9BACE|nr:hypothetical protein [Bacteroides pyogenes]GAE14587.1 hypothetical protein JCM6292_746 [Bacteroides pyogenes JCM 6292]MBR8720001.1 hypothetical protein [Bacteroides pyogenes]MBR8725542.1 hypothetical protein [Bacteroides pyogenes]MBR8737677.1 hypothetical protein [Bacteroides pyogenes]MBR8753277.1 hypothetical protein [Bacteroides pyogenes]